MARLPSVSGGSEEFGGGDFAATEGAIREVLADTGLFSSRGPRRLGWAHRTFAEYLAARYLVARGLGVAQIEDLILHPHQPGRVVPQLQQAAAWLAGMDPEVFRALLASDPGVLARGDVERVADADREALVAALPKAAAAGRLDDVDLDARSEYRMLGHPRLAGQLGSVLADPSAGPVARRMAIDIAQGCHVGALQGSLMDLVLDRSEDMMIRVVAGHAVRMIGDEPTRLHLTPLLAADMDEDTQDDLKGCALTALWPGLIAAEEVFGTLTPPKRQNYFGSYAGFLASDLVAASAGPTSLSPCVGRRGKATPTTSPTPSARPSTSSCCGPGTRSRARGSPRPSPRSSGGGSRRTRT